jgi:hypothetical protein
VPSVLRAGFQALALGDLQVLVCCWKSSCCDLICTVSSKIFFVSEHSSSKPQKMEPYYSLVLSFGLQTVLSTRLVDIISEVPEEIGVMILR